MFKISTKSSTYLNLLEGITTTPYPPTLVIICSSRAEFLTQLQTQISSSLSTVNEPRGSQDEIPASQDEEGEAIELESEIESGIRTGTRAEIGIGQDVNMTNNIDTDTTTTTTTTTTTPTHPLLTPTLHLLCNSKTIRLAFCSSINSLRAYIASYDPHLSNSHVHNHSNIQSDPLPPPQLPPRTQTTTTKTKKIILVNALSLHQGTSEYSMQGLSQTFAGVVGMGWRVGVEIRVVEVEEQRLGEKGPWDVEVPLLSVGVASGVAARPGGVGSWAGRRVRVGDVLGRWFDFE